MRALCLCLALLAACCGLAAGQSGAPFDTSLSIAQQRNFTGFGDISCDPTYNRYKYTIRNFFVAEQTEFNAQLECSDGGTSETSVTVPGRTDSAVSVGELYLYAASGGVANRICRASLLMRNPQPQTANDNGFVLLGQSPPLMCGDTVVDYDRDRAVKAALDDDDSSPLDLQASFEDGRLWESPVLAAIVIAILISIFVAVLAFSAATAYKGVVDYTSMASTQGSAESRKQLSNGARAQRPQSPQSAYVPVQATYSAGGFHVEHHHQAAEGGSYHQAAEDTPYYQAAEDTPHYHTARDTPADVHRPSPRAYSTESYPLVSNEAMMAAGNDHLEVLL